MYKSSRSDLISWYYNYDERYDFINDLEVRPRMLMCEYKKTM